AYSAHRRRFFSWACGPSSEWLFEEAPSDRGKGGNMNRLVIALVVALAMSTARVVPAQTTLTVAGAPLDHLVCYKMRDKTRVNSSTDLITQLQPEFTQRGCIIVKPIEFCVPATKINVSPIPTNPNIVGTPLKNDYICYLAKCKNPLP